MRKFILCMLVLLAYSNIEAQNDTQYGFSKGDWLLSGSFNFFNNQEEYTSLFNDEFDSSESKRTSFSFSPQIGYQVSKNINLGVKTTYARNKTTFDPEEYTYKANQYDISTYARYYFSPNKRFSFFTELEGGYSYVKGETQRTEDSPLLNQTNESESNGLFVRFIPGMNFFISKRLALTSRIGEVSYRNTRRSSTFNDGRSDSRFKQLSASFNLSNFYLGILYRI